jgi:integrase
LAKPRTKQNIQQLGPKRYKVTVNIAASQSPDGKRHRRVAYVTGGKREAEDKRDELRTLARAGSLTPRVKGTLVAYLSAYVENRRRSKRKPVAARTAARWQTIIRQQVEPHLGDLDLRQLKPPVLRKLYDDLEDGGLSGTTCQKVHAFLRQALNQAVRDGDLARNPVLQVDSPSLDTPEVDALDEAQLKDLLAKLRKAESPVYLATLFLAHTAVRRGELLATRWQDIADGWLTVGNAVDESKGEVRLKPTKTGRTRYVKLTPELDAALAAHKPVQDALADTYRDRWQDNDLVFPAEDEHRGKPAGRIWRPSSFSRVFRAETRAVGFEIGSKTLRHTHATILRRAGIPADEVADRLGHSSPRMIESTYGHVLPDRKDRMAGVFESALAEAE